MIEQGGHGRQEIPRAASGLNSARSIRESGQAHQSETEIALAVEEIEQRQHERRRDQKQRRREDQKGRKELKAVQQAASQQPKEAAGGLNTDVGEAGAFEQMPDAVAREPEI